MDDEERNKIYRRSIDAFGSESQILEYVLCDVTDGLKFTVTRDD